MADLADEALDLLLSSASRWRTLRARGRECRDTALSTAAWKAQLDRRRGEGQTINLITNKATSPRPTRPTSHGVSGSAMTGDWRTSSPAVPITESLRQYHRIPGYSAVMRREPVNVQPIADQRKPVVTLNVYRINLILRTDRGLEILLAMLAEIRRFAIAFGPQSRRRQHWRHS